MKKPNPALECKSSQRRPTYRKTQVLVVADMRFRSVASLHQVGALRAQFWSGGTGEARLEMRE